MAGFLKNMKNGPPMGPRWFTRRSLKFYPKYFVADTAQVLHGKIKIWVVRLRSNTWTSLAMPVKLDWWHWHHILLEKISGFTIRDRLNGKTTDCHKGIKHKKHLLSLCQFSKLGTFSMFSTNILIISFFTLPIQYNPLFLKMKINKQFPYFLWKKIERYNMWRNKSS